MGAYLVDTNFTFELPRRAGEVHEAAEAEATGRRRVRLIFRSLFFTTPYRQLSSALPAIPTLSAVRR